ncbi:mitochondrial ribosomal protein L16 [Tirmania nivea]|nr:mitochondrial ribosomal protein L16 [Tirmania nivea]
MQLFSRSSLLPRLSPAAPRLRARPATLLPPSTSARSFSCTAAPSSWLLPKTGCEKGGKSKKGRPRVHTGGSTRGTTVVWGDYGLRLKDHHRRLSALQLKNGEDTIKKVLRGMRFRLFMRVSANIPVYTKGNESRMGTGKGSMDYWSCRVPVSRIIFELKGEIHEKVARQAFRLAGNKMPGTYEFVKKGDPPMMGLVKLTPDVVEKLRTSKAPFALKKYLPVPPPPPVEPEAVPPLAI